MAHTLVGSRYLLRIARRGARESTFANDYFAIHPGDSELEAPSGDLVGYVHSCEIGSTADGPGLRIVVTLTGCFLRCLHCHNPDTWHKYNGSPVTVSRLMKLIGKYAPALGESRGGVTLSGGEPLAQRGFLVELLRRCKAIGLHTCVDTSGHLGDRLSDDDLAAIDLTLLNIKSVDPDVHEHVTGQPLAPTLGHARRLSALQRPTWIRYVLVPGLTDGYGNVEEVADFCASLAGVERVQILRFHQMGRGKWAQLGLDYALRDVAPPPPDMIERVRGQFRRRGLAVG